MNLKPLLAASLTANVGLICALAFLLLLVFKQPSITGPSIIYLGYLDKTKAVVVEKPAFPAHDLGK